MAHWQLIIAYIALVTLVAGIGWRENQTTQSARRVACAATIGTWLGLDHDDVTTDHLTDAQRETRRLLVNGLIDDCEEAFGFELDTSRNQMLDLFDD